MIQAAKMMHENLKKKKNACIHIRSLFLRNFMGNMAWIFSMAQTPVNQYLFVGMIFTAEE